MSVSMNLPQIAGIPFRQTSRADVDGELNNICLIFDRSGISEWCCWFFFLMIFVVCHLPIYLTHCESTLISKKWTVPKHRNPFFWYAKSMRRKIRPHAYGVSSLSSSFAIPFKSLFRILEVYFTTTYCWWSKWKCICVTHTHSHAGNKCSKLIGSHLLLLFFFICTIQILIAFIQ